jgi:hypothetical protein
MEQRIGRGPGNLNSNDWKTGGDSVDFQQLISMFSVLCCAWYDGKNGFKGMTIYGPLRLNKVGLQHYHPDGMQLWVRDKCNSPRSRFKLTALLFLLQLTTIAFQIESPKLQATIIFVLDRQAKTNHTTSSTPLW